MNDREKLVELLEREVAGDVDGDEGILPGVGELAEFGQEVNQIDLAGNGFIARVQESEAVSLENF